MAVTLSEIRTKVRKLLADDLGISPADISGLDNLGDPPLLGYDLISFKGLKADINNNILKQYGPNPRITKAKLEKLHRDKKKVKDLDREVWGLAKENENNASA